MKIIEIQEGSCEVAWINQTHREFEVIKLNRKRARIWYELPNSGDTYAWIPVTRLHGKAYINVDSYQEAAPIDKVIEQEIMGKHRAMMKERQGQIVRFDPDARSFDGELDAMEPPN